MSAMWQMFVFQMKLQKVEFNPIETSHPMEILHINYLTIKSGKSNRDINILVVTIISLDMLWPLLLHHKQLKLPLKH